MRVSRADGYNKTEVEYQWTAGRGVSISSDMKLSQFDLKSSPIGNQTVIFNKGAQHLPGRTVQSGAVLS